VRHAPMFAASAARTLKRLSRGVSEPSSGRAAGRGDRGDFFARTWDAVTLGEARGAVIARAPRPASGLRVRPRRVSRPWWGSGRQEQVRRWSAISCRWNQEPQEDPGRRPGAGHLPRAQPHALRGADATRKI